jgi:hypothetical protein
MSQRHDPSFSRLPWPATDSCVETQVQCRLAYARPTRKPGSYHGRAAAVALVRNQLGLRRTKSGQSANRIVILSVVSQANAMLLSSRSRIQKFSSSRIGLAANDLKLALRQVRRYSEIERQTGAGISAALPSRHRSRQVVALLHHGIVHVIDVWLLPIIRRAEECHNGEM